MSFKKERYQLVPRKENDGLYSFDTEMIVTKDVLDIIGKKALKKIRKRIKKTLKVKEQIYGNTSETDMMCEFPEEIYFKDKVTGTIVSLKQVETEEILDSTQDLFLIGKHNPEKEPLLIKSQDKGSIEKLLNAPYLVQFELDLRFPNEQ